MERNPYSQRLPRASLCYSHHVLAAQGHRETLGLDGCGLLEVLLHQDVHHILCKAKAGDSLTHKRLYERWSKKDLTHEETERGEKRRSPGFPNFIGGGPLRPPMPPPNRGLRHVKQKKHNTELVWKRIRLKDMPLFFQNRELDCFRSTAELFDKYPHLQENAKAFRSKPRVDVDPKHLLYVQQREFAATTPADNSVSILGSDDATTCHLVVLRHTDSYCELHLLSAKLFHYLAGSGAVCLSHLDGSSTRTEVQLTMKAVTSLSNGCSEGRHKQKDHIHLETCCITGFIFLSFVNTVVGHSDFSVTILSIVEMNNVVDKGIHKPIMTDIYDSRHGLIKVGPCRWSPDLEISFWLSQSDDTILKYLSTSPFAEPPHFVQHIKSTIQFLLSHPNSDSLFPGGQPHLYQRTESGSWERLVQKIRSRSQPQPVEDCRSRSLCWKEFDKQ
ncbi:hypothetical protein CCH79_00012772, partial [Gambusia affinis]